MHTLSSLFDSILQHIWIATASIIALLAILFAVWSKYTKSLWGKDFWVVLPVVGRMSEWKKMTEGTGDYASRMSPDAGYVERTLVVPAERALYDYYDDCLEKTSRNGFINAREYLKISGQNGRKPMSPVLWIILGALTVAEAFGTGLLLAPLLSRDITPELAMIGGTVIALVIAIVAVLITHGAGEDWFANTLLAKARNTFKQNKGFRRADGSRSQDFVRAIGPEDDQEKDSVLEPDGRLAARIGATSMASMQPRRLRIIAAVMFIVLFAIGTAAYRHYVFNKQQDAAAAGSSAADSGGNGNFSNLFGQSGANATAPLPAAVARDVQQSDQHAKNAINQDNSDANDAGIMILTLIYVFTQLLGFLTGAKYSFFNKDAELAYQKTLGQLGYDDFLRIAVRPVAQRAQMRLGQLRAKLSSANPGYGDHMKSFDFMEAYHDSLAEYERTTQASTRRAPAPERTEAPSAPASAASSGGATAAASATPSTGPSLEALAKSIIEVSDSEQRRRVATELIRQHGLTREQQGELASIILRMRKEPEINPDLLGSL